MASLGGGGISPLERFGKLAPAQKALVAVLVMALAGVVFYLVFYQELEGEIQKEKRKKLTLEKTLSEYQVQLQNKQQFQEQIRNLEKKRQTALEKLPEKAEIPQLLSKIHGQAKIVGLNIKGFERLQEVGQGFYSAIPVMMSLEGTYGQIATFFYYVGKLTRIVNLTNIELQLDAGANNEIDPVPLSGRVLATTFRYSPVVGGSSKRGKKKKGGGGE
jgi:type IV pilus assembly protein PilO